MTSADIKLTCHLDWMRGKNVVIANGFVQKLSDSRVEILELLAPLDSVYVQQTKEN